jgi:glycosyltransferase involved in cell wall biosynthesis
MPTVSIIIPNYNHELYLVKRIESCLNQTYRDFEVIILDDCSTDNSRDIIESYRHHAKISRIVYNDANSGSPFKQWQKGFGFAEGDFIWIAESDDYADPKFLEVMMKSLSSTDDIVISYCRSVSIDKEDNITGLNMDADVMNGKKWNRDYVEWGYKELKLYLNYKNTIPNASAVVFRNLPALSKKLNTRMKYCGDWWFWKNMLQGNVKIAYSHLPLNYFRSHSGTTRSSALSKISESMKFREFKKFVPLFYLRILDNRFRWMMDMWIERSAVFTNTFHQYIPILHPALVIKYYLWLIKKKLKKRK